MIGIMSVFSFTIRSILGALALGWLFLLLPPESRSAPAVARVQNDQPSTQASIRIAIRVKDSSLPVTIGVPVAESTGLTDISRLGVAGREGKPVPASFRVLARWRGTVEDRTRVIKWLLVDFAPSGKDVHYLEPLKRPLMEPMQRIENNRSLRISNGKVSIEFARSGEELLRSFQRNGSDQLRAGVRLQMSLPPRAIVTRIDAAGGEGPITVTDASIFRTGEIVRFEHRDRLKWDAPAGSDRLVTYDQSFGAGRKYLLSEGTPRREEVTVTSAQPGDLRAEKPLIFGHPAGSSIRDLSIEGESATISKITGQTIAFANPIKSGHVTGEILSATNTDQITATAAIERTWIEEESALRVVVRQDGIFKTRRSATPTTIQFTSRFHIYAGLPFVRVQLRLVNRGSYGFGGTRTGIPPFAQHVLLRKLSLDLPTIEPAREVSAVLAKEDAHARLNRAQSGASIAAGDFVIAVPEFIENFPRALVGSPSGISFDILPDTGEDHVFDGARAKTVEFYLGSDTPGARQITSSLNATLDPAYVASTGAVRPSFVEKRDWAREFAGSPQLLEAARRVERMLAVGYAVEAAEGAGAVPPQSIFEYRFRSENGEHFGWRNFGDLAWGDGYANVHYDLPFILLRESLRTADERAFRIGSEMARYRADWGQYQADDYFDRDRIWNFRGTAFYEKGDHGSYREPVPSHMWIEGLWLHWAMTGDWNSYHSAIEGSEAFARMKFNYDNALGWNEPRWVGWPILGLVTAWRYSGRSDFLDRARRDIDLLMSAEEDDGKKGYFIGRGSGFGRAVQPWAWSYSLLGVIEYWRDTGDRRVGDFIVRVADWLISSGSPNPPLKPGSLMPDGTWLPAGVSYFWYPDRVADDRSVALAGLCLPVLTTAAQISGRTDLWKHAEDLFRDYAFYRDLPEGKSTDPAARAVINFRSLHFAGSSPKVYGQMGLTVQDFLSDYPATHTKNRLKDRKEIK